jgi:hypothetical protein
MKSALLSLFALAGLVTSAQACPVAVSGLSVCHQAAVVQVVPLQTFAVQAVAPVAVVQTQAFVIPPVQVQAVPVQQVGFVQVLAAPIVKVKNFCARGHCGGVRVQGLRGREVIRERRVERRR